MRKILYQIQENLSPNDFIDILKRSQLSERRPINDQECMKGMCENSNLIVCAYDQDQLIGVARSITDFYYACYLSDLAVDQAYQGQGVGTELICRTQDQLQRQCKLILLSAPDANLFYEKIGMEPHPRAWVLDRGQQLKSR